MYQAQFSPFRSVAFLRCENLSGDEATLASAGSPLGPYCRGAVRRILGAVNRRILGAVRRILGAVRRILGAVRRILGAVRRILGAVRRRF